MQFYAPVTPDREEKIYANKHTTFENIKHASTLNDQRSQCYEPQT